MKARKEEPAAPENPAMFAPTATVEELYYEATSWQRKTRDLQAHRGLTVDAETVPPFAKDVDVKAGIGDEVTQSNAAAVADKYRREAAWWRRAFFCILNGAT